MGRALVSCIIPVFNGERYLREALDSIFAQTYPETETIVVDDGSTDGTAEVAAACADRVCYLRQANAGPSAARNHGISKAQGEFVAFLDADDLWTADKLARQMARFDARPELTLSVAHAQNFWIPELSHEAEKFRGHRIAQPLPAFTPPTLVVRRSYFKEVGPFNESLKHGHSTEWILRATERGAVIELLPDVLLRRRLHENNRSRVRAEGSREEYLQLVKASLDRRRKT